MSKHSDIARNLFEDGYNCSQSVVAAFCDEMDIDLDLALRMSSSFGGGMGRLREVCGAVTGMFVVLGIMYGYTDPTDSVAKAAHYELVQSVAGQFKSKNSSLICRDLLGLSVEHDSPIPEERTDSYYSSRPCADLVVHAATILDEYIQHREIKGEENDKNSDCK